MKAALLFVLMIAAPGLWAATAPRELTWAEMIPPDAPKIAPQMTPLHDLSKMGSDMESAPAVKQQQPDAPVVKALDGQNVKMPGFIVPLEVSDDGRTTDFLLVPYYGACIHVPPPPSNQIVHVTSQVGVKLDDLYQAFWVEGTMRVKRSDSELADAGYQMEADKIYIYELPE
ncbi:DUF3299 domain-containing protein [Pseudomonas sp. App30]|uniref:DUF3299 domain-containing protein n=1 Tax=Pseudomonas sp. App30 TaxID=3068990 RepID=UPI003A7FC213